MKRSSLPGMAGIVEVVSQARRASLFLCADPTQGFLKRRLSWSAVGLDVRSHSHRLEKPYRSTRAILEFARDFYRSRLSEDDEPLNLPAPEWLETLEPGTPPIVQPGGAGQDQLRRLTADLKELQKAEVPPGHILHPCGGPSPHHPSCDSSPEHAPRPTHSLLRA